MNAETFCEHFATFADATNGVKKLRELIFDLAANGRILSGITAEVVESESRLLGDVAEFVMGQAPPGNECNKSGIGTVFVKTGEFGLLYPDTVEWTTKPLKFARPGDVLICVVGATVGKLNLAIDCAIGRSVAAIRPAEGLGTRFLYYMLMPFVLKLRHASRGSAQGVIGKEDLSKVRIWVPSEGLQRRIVEKVDELLGLCDELAARQAAQREKRQQLVGATLDRLVSTRNPAEFPTHAHRLRNHFDQLFDTPTTIPQLRQTILQLAVQGYLVPHDHNDEPANFLLERIMIEKAKLVGEKKVRQPKARSEDGEPPFALPNSWVWAQAEDVCKPADVITYGVLKPEWVTDGVPTVRVQDMKNGQIVVGQIGQCSPARADKFSKTTLEEGDLLIAKDGATLGKTAFVPPSLVGGNVTQHVLRFPISPHVWRWYIRLFVDSPLGQAWMRKETRGVALPGVNVEDFRRMPIPLPPLAEQKRIVTKVTELLSLCDALEAKLTQAESASTQLLSAAVHQLLEAH